MRLSEYVLDNREKTSKTLFNSLLLGVTWPAFVIGFALNIIPFTLPVIIRKELKVEYVGFYSSIQYALGAIIFPVYYLLSAFIFSYIPISGWFIPLLVLAQYGFGKFAYYWFENANKLATTIRHRILKRTAAQKIDKIMHLRQLIIQKIIE